MKGSKKSQSTDKTVVLSKKTTDMVENAQNNTQSIVDAGNGVVCCEKEKVKHKWHLGHPENGRFSTLLIRIFISFSIIIIIGVASAFIASYWVANRHGVQNASANITNYLGQLSSGNFDKIPRSTLWGDDGWFEIVDTNGNIVYSSLQTPNTYTVGDLDMIQRYGVNERIGLSTFNGTANEVNLLVTKLTYDENGEEQEQYLLLDEDLRVIAGSIATTKTHFTEREFQLLTYNAHEENGQLNKIGFVGEDGEDYFAIFLDMREEISFPSEMMIGLVCTFIIVLFAVVIFFYVRYLNKHVQKPLTALSNAMSHYAKDNSKEKIEYKGSKELEQLCDSYNEMITLLNASEEQRVALEQDKQRVLAGLSHDLKTPITIIQGFAKAIRDGIVSEEDKQKYLQLIVKKTDLMTALVNEFYEYTKLEHPDFALDTQRTDVAELARTFLASIYDEFELRGYNLETNIEETPLICDIDKQQFTHVFGNLTTNFFKYTQQGSTLYFGVERVGDKAKIVIADNGGGIPQENRDEIFKPFVVGEKSRNKQGSGLGLAVCEKIVNAHGGSIRLADDMLEGYTTQFVVELPLLQQ